MRVRRCLRVLADAAQIRTAKFDGEQHYVLPVVAMIGDAVVLPLNSEGPEYVPAAELAVVPKGLDGRPVVPDHPMGGRESANQPHILERYRYGITFHSSFSDNRLRCEIYLNPVQAERVGDDAMRVLEVAKRALAGEKVAPVEISLGVFTSIIEESGVSPNGEPYQFRWEGISYDHLAVGLGGHEGACSVEMGCGTPRVNSKTKSTAVLRVAENEGTSDAVAILHRRYIAGDPARTDALEQERDRATTKGANMAKRNLLSRVLEAMRPAQGEGVSELWMKISAALEAVVPQFMGVEEVFPDDSLVVYSARVEDKFSMFRRKYSIDGEGAVELGDEEQVEPQLSYEPVAASAACACDGKCKCGAGSVPAPVDSNTGRSARQGDEVTKRAEELVGRLIALESAPFDENDRKRLSAWTEESLQALVESYDKLDELEIVEPTAEEEGDEEPELAPDTVALARDEYNEIKAAATAYRKQQDQHKAGLVARLAAAQSSYTEPQLKAKEIEDLEALAGVLKLNEPETAPSYVGARVSGEPEGGMERFAAPDAYGLGKKTTKQKEAN